MSDMESKFLSLQVSPFTICIQQRLGCYFDLRHFEQQKSILDFFEKISIKEVTCNPSCCIIDLDLIYVGIFSLS